VPGTSKSSGAGRHSSSRGAAEDSPWKWRLKAAEMACRHGGLNTSSCPHGAGSDTSSVLLLLRLAAAAALPGRFRPKYFSRQEQA
jgi:hypothetical protein